MNKKQLKSLINSYLSKSPNRSIELAQAIEERWRRSQEVPSHGRPCPNCDALDEWIALCLSEKEAGKGGEMENRVAEFIERLSTGESREAAGKCLTTGRAAYHGNGPPSPPIPFSDDEIRAQVRSVLRDVARRKSER